ncbi:MAG TPA: sigma 54-interacting transcriptional regulator [Vicinamibacterales bacterium]|nr:sigma 54-interacting transcriptional regulator [Vicinamibacterales bacterium]
MISTVRLGVSAAIREVEDEIVLAARSNVRVLISGERGVGKGMVACLIHEGSARRGAELVAIRCGGTPDDVLGAALFGHAGPGDHSQSRRRGALESADRGTVFLDEIADTSRGIQARLKHFVETGEVRPVGAERPLPALDVRLVASTEASLADLVEDGRFDAQLYYRLNVLHIRIPPLRERREDIAMLLQDCLRRSAALAQRQTPSVTSGASQRLADYTWPGNIREMRQVADRLVARCGNGQIEVNDLPDEISHQGRARGPDRYAGIAVERSLLDGLSDRRQDRRQGHIPFTAGGTGDVMRSLALLESGPARSN